MKPLAGGVPEEWLTTSAGRPAGERTIPGGDRLSEGPPAVGYPPRVQWAPAEPLPGDGKQYGPTSPARLPGI